MIPGALAAMAAVLLSGRDDWQRRIVYFAMFGALGWSFGGSISYMQVVAYTHSGDSPSVFYGFACLFVIGFLWAALGGAGTALPAVVDQSFLDALFLTHGRRLPPLVAARRGHRAAAQTAGFRAVLVRHRLAGGDAGLVAALLVWAIRRRLDPATSLVLHLAAGWWAGFLILVLVLRLHMTPPRGDNWAGCLGMTAGLFWYCRQTGLRELARAALYCGFIGGIGFAAASMLKLVEVTSGYQTNWHSILEQTTGLFNGIGIAVAVTALARRTVRPPPDLPDRRPWTEPLALGFVLLGITYLNLRKNVAQWVDAKIDAGGDGRPLRRGPGSTWDTLRLGADALRALVAASRGGRWRSCLQAGSARGSSSISGYSGGWSSAISSVRSWPSQPERLVTEGVIYLVALACTLVLLLRQPDRGDVRSPKSSPGRQPRATLGTGRD